MAVVKTVKNFGTVECHRYVMADGDVATVKLPDALKGAVSVDVTAPGNGKVETTISHPDYIDATTAKWDEWPAGTVSVDQAATPFCCRINGIRLTAAGGGGSVTFELLLQKER